MFYLRVMSAVERQSNACPFQIPKLDGDDGISVNYFYITPSYHQQRAYDDEPGGRDLAASGLY